MEDKPIIYSFYFSFKSNKRVPASIVKIFLSYMLVSFLILVFIDTSVGGIMMVAFLGFFFLFKEHLIIDITNKKYRYAIDFCGFNFGAWHALPDIEYISIFTKQYRNKSFEESGQLHWNETFSKLEVNLIIDRRKRLNVWIGKNKVSALKAAKFLAANLDLEILDATQRPSKWLD